MIGAALVTISGASSSEGPSPLVGNFLVLAGTLFAAVYVVLSSRYVAETAPLALAALQQSVGFIFALLLFAVTLLTGWERFPATIQPSSVLLALGSGVAQYALPFWLYLTGLSVLRTSTSALFLALIPVFGVGGAVLFLSESLHPQQLLGCAIVVIAGGSDRKTGELDDRSSVVAGGARFGNRHDGLVLPVRCIGRLAALRQPRTLQRRTSVKEALEIGNTDIGQHSRLCRRFHAFRHRFQAECLGNSKQSANDGLCLGSLIDGAHERAVDFDRVDGQHVKLPERGIARAEIVDGDAAAEIADSGDKAGGLLDVLERGRLGDFHD
jgi:uncharacterized membrane protein